ncbi:hypothetical protein JCM9957A_16970 [Kineosporia succinea]
MTGSTGPAGATGAVGFTGATGPQGLAAAGASHCTVTAPTLLLGGTASVTGTWDVPMTTTTYGVIVEPSTSSLLGSVSWQVVTKTTTQVTLTVKALVAIASSGTLYLSAVR